MTTKLPSFQFYPGDWTKDPSLRRCSKSAKGFLIDAMCVLFENEERGVFSTCGDPWSDDEIAIAVGGDTAANLELLAELLDKRCLKRNNGGAVYSARMVRDEAIRRERAKAGAKGGRNSKGKSKLQANDKQNTEEEVEDEVEKESCFSGGSAEGEDRGSPDAVVFPLGSDCLDTPEFRAQWDEWLAYRTEKRYGRLASRTVQSQLLKLAKVGHDRAIATIRMSIENDWKGLFPDKAGGGGGASSPQVRAEARRADKASREHPDDAELTFK